MTTTISSSPRQPAIPPLPVRRLSVHEFHALIDANAFADNENFEFLDGWLFEKSMRNPRHDGTVDRLDETLRELRPAGWRVRVQLAITTEDSEPEPDVVLALGGARDFDTRHPGPADIGLVVEVSDASLAKDRGLKQTIYARAKISTYWIVNVADNVIEVYTKPTGSGENATFGSRRDFRAGEIIELQLGAAVIKVDVAAILPEAESKAKPTPVPAPRGRTAPRSRRS